MSIGRGRDFCRFSPYQRLPGALELERVASRAMRRKTPPIRGRAKGLRAGPSDGRVTMLGVTLLRSIRPILQAGLTHVADDADDRTRGAAGEAQAGSDAAADWRFAAP